MSIYDLDTRTDELGTEASDIAPGRGTLTSRLVPPSRQTLVFRVENAEAANALADRFGARDDNGVAGGADVAIDRASSSSGAPLPGGVKDQFEASTGADLSAVRVHTGADSESAAGAVGARAYTTGQDIHFGSGQYAPSDPFGLHLLAHEVAHTVQQAGGATAAPAQYKLEVSAPGDALEVEADHAADAMVAGRGAAITGASGLARKTIQREGDPAAAPAPGAPASADDADVKTQATAERAKIETELASAKTQMGMNAAARADIDKEMAAAQAALDAAKAKNPGEDPTLLPEHEKVDTLTKRKTEFDAMSDKIQKVVDKNSADLKTIDNPGTPAAQLRDILARRKSDTASGESHEVTTVDNQTKKDVGQGSKVSDSSTTVTQDSKNVNGVAVTDTTTTNSKLGPGGAEWGEKKEVNAVSGDNSGSNSNSTQNKVGADGYTRTTEHKDSEQNGDVASSSSNKTTTNVGPGGASQTKEKTEQVDDYQVKEKTTVGATRGNGDVGVNASKSSSAGKVDADGNVVDGSKTTVSGEAHVHADKDSVGAGGSAKVNHEVTDASGVKVGVTPMCDGNVSVSVKPYDGDNEALKDRFMVVTTITAGVGAGGSVGGGKDEGNNVGVEGSAKVSAHGTWQHTMTADETKQYLADLGGVTKENAGNGSHPEMAQISAAWRNNWAAGAEAVKSAADSKTPMAEGDKVEYGVDASADAKAKAQVDGGVATVGVNVGVSKKGSLKFSIAMNNGKRVVTVAEADETTTSEGGNVGAGGIKAGVNESQSTSSGKSATFFLDPGGAQSSIEDEIKSATSAADIAALCAKYPALLQEHTETTGKKDSESIDIGTDKVGFKMGGENKVDKSVTTDKDGKQTEVDSGSNASSGAVRIGDKEIGDKHEEAIKTTVDADGKATGDLNKTDTGTDLDKSAKAWDDSKKQSGAVGAATGSTGPKPVDSVDQEGLLLSDSDYSTIVGAASDPVGWMKHCSSPSKMDNWRALGGAIRGCGGDRKKLGAALAQYMGSGGKEAVLAEIVRPSDGDSNSGGVGYEFPDGMAGLKSQYTALVFNDPSTDIKALKDAGKGEDAAAAAKKKIADLDSLFAQLNTAHDQFKDPAALGEMIKRIGDRKQQLSAFIGGSDGQKSTDRYNQLLGNCTSHKQSEDQLFAQMQDKKDDHDAIAAVGLENQLRTLYKDWDGEYAEMEKLGQANGFDAGIYGKYRPDHERWNNFHDGKSDKDLGDKRAADAEKEVHDRDQARDSAAVADAAYKSSPAYAQAQAQQQVDQNVKDRNDAIEHEKGEIAAAKAKALKSSAWTQSGKPVPASAQGKVSEGWTAWKAGLAGEEHFKFVCSQPQAIAAGVAAAAGDVIKHYFDAECAFEEAQGS